MYSNIIFFRYHGLYINQVANPFQENRPFRKKKSNSKVEPFSNTALKAKFLEHNLSCFSFKTSVKILVKNSFPLCLNQIGRSFSTYKNIVRRVFYCLGIFIFQRNRPSKLTDIVNHDKYIYIIYYFQDRNPLNLIYLNSKYHQYDKHLFC